VVHRNGRGWTLVRSGVVNWDSGGQPVTIGGTSDRDIWLVTVNADGKAVVEHWDGARFSQVHLPLPAGTKGEQLTSVSAVSRTDAWAVGYYVPTNGPTATLVEHWNGTAWKLVAFPNPGRDGKDRPSSELSGVSALSPDDVWVCGFYPVPGGQLRTLLAHWNGTRWQQIATPASVKITNLLNGISAPAPDDIWSVGGTTTIKGVQQPIALHHS
jgi:hypothetical protein